VTEKDAGNGGVKGAIVLRDGCAEKIFANGLDRARGGKQIKINPGRLCGTQGEEGGSQW